MSEDGTVKWVMVHAMMESGGNEERAIELVALWAGRNPKLANLISNELAAAELAAAVHELKAKVLRKIASRLSGKQTARDVFTDDDIVKLIEETAIEVFGEPPSNLVELIMNPNEDDQ